MQEIGVWHITENGPAKLAPSSIDLEAHLEVWIERDPALLEAGLVIIGRQFHVEGGPIDLLAIDPQGRWAVIEIKRGTVRRDTIAQALDYASCIATMPYDELAQKANAYLAKSGAGEMLDSVLATRLGTAAVQDEARNIVMFVVGTDRDAGLERMVQYLANNFGMSLRVVTYKVFETEPGRRLLVRELSASEISPPPLPKPSSITVEQVCSLADSLGTGAPFRAILDASTALGLHARPYKTSIMYAPPSNKTRCLFTVWTHPDEGTGRIGIWVGAETFAQFYPVTEEQVTEELGGNGWLKLEPAAIGGFVEGVNRLFAQIGAAS
jgi:Holliday junction resolvase-like predicted endonuclease